MKAIIQFEIKDDKNISDEEIKQKLVQVIADVMEDWLKGDTVLMIDFIHTYNNEDSKKDNIFNFYTDETIH